MNLYSVVLLNKLKFAEGLFQLKLSLRSRFDKQLHELQDRNYRELNLKERLFDFV